MAPKRPAGVQNGMEPAARGAPTPGQRTTSRGDVAFMEEVVRELAAQNEHARGELPLVAGEKAAAPAASTERPRTVRVDRDSGFRTAEGVATARAYLPARTLAPGRTEPVETETVKVSDPRRLPTVRLPRDRDSSPSSSEGSARPSQPSSPVGSARPSVPEDSAPTLRSAPVPSSRPAERSVLGFWIGGVILVALAGVLVVMLAARMWPQGSMPGGSPTASPAPSARGGATASGGREAQHVTAPPAVTAAVEAPSAATARSSEARPRSSSGPRPGTTSDRWF